MQLAAARRRPTEATRTESVVLALGLGGVLVGLAVGLSSVRGTVSLSGTGSIGQVSALSSLGTSATVAAAAHAASAATAVATR